MSENPYQTPAAALGDGSIGLREPSPSVVTIANVVYALHTLAIVVAIVGAATIIGSFLFSIPSIVAVILNYWKQSEARGTWVESHFRWQIRTFWFAMLGVGIAILLVISIVGILVVWVIPLVLSVWLIYRIARGWLRLRDRKPMYV